jgi:carbamoyl-phosphate synthase large subunit
VVTGTGGAGVGRQLIRALRLGKLKYYLTALNWDAYSTGFSEADESYVVPPASSSDYTDQMLRICERSSSHLLLPGNEYEFGRINHDKEVFAKHSVTPLINNGHVLDVCLDKMKTHTFLEENGFSTPKTYILDPGSKTAVQSLPNDEYPFVLKPAESGGGGAGGSIYSFIAQTPDEVEFYKKAIERQGMKALVQQYVGTAQDEYTVGILHYPDGTLAGSICMKRDLSTGLSARLKVKSYKGNQTYVISSGISQGQFVDDKKLSEYCERLATKLGSTGPLNVQCRKVGDKIYPFEINPRFSGTCACRALAGFNEVEMYIRYILDGEKIIRPPIRYVYCGRDLVPMLLDGSAPHAPG